MKKQIMTAFAISGLVFAVGCQERRSEEGVTGTDRAAGEQQEPGIGGEGWGQEQPGQEQAGQEQAGQEQMEHEQMSQEQMRAHEQMTQTTTGQLTQAGSDKLTLRDEQGRELELKVDESTLVTREGQRVEIDQLEEGSQVRASYILDQDELHARDIEVLGAEGQQQMQQEEKLEFWQDEQQQN